MGYNFVTTSEPRGTTNKVQYGPLNLSVRNVSLSEGYWASERIIYYPTYKWYLVHRQWKFGRRNEIHFWGRKA